MRRYPQSGFSLARRRITLRSGGDVGGRLGRWLLVVHRRVTKSACQPKSVPGVTNRCRRRVLGSSRASALSRARSTQVGRGRVTCWRKMLTWWRSTRISAVLDASDRMRSANQVLSWQKIRYTSRNVTDADHAEPNPTRITPGQHSGRVSGTGAWGWLYAAQRLRDAVLGVRVLGRRRAAEYTDHPAQRHRPTSGTPQVCPALLGAGVL